MAHYVTTALLFVEINRGKEGTNHIKYYMELGAMEACRNRMTEATKGLVHRGAKGSTKDLFIFDS